MRYSLEYRETVLDALVINNITQHDMKLDKGTYESFKILSISLTDKNHLKNLFNKTNFQNNKERCDLKWSKFI